MKKIVVILLIGLCTQGFAEDGILSPSQDLKLDLQDASVSIAKVSRKIQPLAKKLDAGAVKVKDAIDAVKDDPNALNKAKFENVLAEHMLPVMQNIDLVLANELEMECAMTDISAEVKRVALRLKQDSTRISTQTDTLRSEMKSIAKELKQKAAEVKASGSSPDEKLVLEMKRIEQRFNLGAQRYKLANHVKRQLEAGLYSLNKSSENMSVASTNMELWFEHLRGNRDNFRTLLKMRRDMANISLIGSRASELGLGDLISSFNKAMKQINQVGDLMAEVGSSVESLDKFNQNVSFDVSILPDGLDGSMDASALADKILDRDYSFLEK